MTDHQAISQLSSSPSSFSYIYLLIFATPTVQMFTLRSKDFFFDDANLDSCDHCIIIILNFYAQLSIFLLEESDACNVCVQTCIDVQQ